MRQEVEILTELKYHKGVMQIFYDCVDIKCILTFIKEDTKWNILFV